MKNTIYLRRKNKILVEQEADDLPLNYIASILKNIERLGYTFSPTLIERLKTLSLDTLIAFENELGSDLKAMLGANVTYEPMYPNFPTQVMEMDEAELYLNAILHYFGDWVGLRIMPKYEKDARSPLLDKTDLTIIELGSEYDFKQICRNLLGANSSLSETDKQDIESFVRLYSDQLETIVPNEIPHKENLAHIASLLFLFGPDIAQAETFLYAHFKTATDVLRLATALSDGDISLAKNTRFRNFKRVERRLLLGMLEQCDTITEDMLRYKTRWIRLGERLHPFEYKTRYPKCAAAFDVIRNNKPFSTFNSRIEQALREGEIVQAAELLQKRPGELARRLDHLLRSSPDAEPVISNFDAVVNQVSTPVLLQLLTHFKHRNDQSEWRIFFPKGHVGKAQAIENKLPPLDKKICDAVVALCTKALIARFKELPALGKVYLDEALSHFVVPFSQRSASKALRTLVRGSRLSFPKGKTIRFFLWWKEGEVNGKHTGRVDIDLSAVMYDAQWRYVEHLSYTNLKSEKYQAAHSGDITSAPNGACEFIDLDIESVANYGGRYVVMSLLSYTQQPFCDLPECYAGWMMRQHPKSGEIFEPKTVQDKIDLAADTRICIPVILDMVAQQVIWADLALTSTPYWQNNVESNQKGMVLMGQALTSLVKPNLYELFDLHTTARGVITKEIEEADTVFSVKSGITPFDIDLIMSKFL